MIVCHCMQLTDRALRAVIREGACTPEQVMRCSGAGSCCGGCQPAIDELLDEERAASGRPSSGKVVRLAVLPSNALAS